MRGADAVACAARLRATLERALLWPRVEKEWARVRVLKGDLAGGRGLGMCEADHALLREAGLHTIVHNGALVNHALPYASLKAANVEGTAGIVRLAVGCATRPVSHFLRVKTDSACNTALAPSRPTAAPTAALALQRHHCCSHCHLAPLI